MWPEAAHLCALQSLLLGRSLLQSYFRERNEQYRFKDEHKRGTSIQNTVQSDSIIERSLCSEEFCNTIGELRGLIVLTPKANLRSASSVSLDLSTTTEKQEVH